MLRDIVRTALQLGMEIWQGCTMAPVLFNLYFCAMVDYWRRQCPQAGVTFCYRFGRKLVGDRTTKERLLRSCITESKFADDAALYAYSRRDFEMVASSFVAVAKLSALGETHNSTSDTAMEKILNSSSLNSFNSPSLSPIQQSGQNSSNMNTPFRVN